jgi:hypothetical protein
MSFSLTVLGRRGKEPMMDKLLKFSASYSFLCPDANDKTCLIVRAFFASSGIE